MSKIAEVLQAHEQELLDDWMARQLAGRGRRDALINDAEVRQQSGEFLRALRDAARSGSLADGHGPQWDAIHALLSSVSRSRTMQGFTPSETASFVFSLRAPLAERLRQAHGDDARALFEDVMQASLLIDKLGLHTTEAFQKAREEVLARQQEELLELSTPVVELWHGVVALPMIGTLDSTRTQVVMENLLHRIVETGAQIAILDITGVPTVDTLTAQHLLKTVAAARLMGAECIISGIRPQIAQTIVHLGLDLGDIVTKSTLAAALQVAMQRLGLRVVEGEPARGEA